MSTLDEAAVVRAREVFQGTVSAVVEEKRIKPTVIRRRKKIVKTEKPAPEAEAAAPEDVEVVAPPETPPVMGKETKAETPAEKPPEEPQAPEEEPAEDTEE